MASIKSLKANVSFVSPSLEWRSIRMSTFSTQLIILNYPAILSHWHRTTVSLETCPLYSWASYSIWLKLFHVPRWLSQQSNEDPFLLQVKTFAGLEVVEWIFLTISVVNVLVAIGLTIDRLVELKKNKPDYTFAIILFINISMNQPLLSSSSLA